MSPYTPSEMQEPPGEIVTIQGTVTGPDNQPLEGIGIWAWQGEVVKQQVWQDREGTASLQYQCPTDRSHWMCIPDPDVAS